MIIGASPAFQAVAQGFGVLTGSLIGSLVYLVLIPDPAGMLLTADWPAPAVATWKAVAEVMAQGLSSLPPAAVPAMTVAALAGLLLRSEEHTSELQSLMRISYAVFCLKKKTNRNTYILTKHRQD